MTEYDDLEKVKVTREGHVAIISMNRPEARNAMSPELTRDFREACRRVAVDEEARAVLIRGEGKSFCAGGDVKGFDEMAKSTNPPSPAKRVADLLGAREILDLILAIPQPTVSAVQGHAIGLGSTIALFCDIVIAADDAQIADMHVNIGVVAGDGGQVMWPLMMPIGAARWYLMTGDRLSGTEAARLGMALKAVPEEELYAEALAAANKLAELPPIALQGTKKTLNRIVQHRMDLTLDYGLLYEGATYLSEDHIEAAAAFVEKRQPKFTGR
jgi:enoyl-CoA hydratase